MVESEEESLWVDDSLGEGTDDPPEGDPAGRDAGWAGWLDGAGDGVAELECLWAIDADDGEGRLRSGGGGGAIDGVGMGGSPEGPPPSDERMQPEPEEGHAAEEESLTHTKD
jgi:hypothetical protein